jgi:hypothetical protein
MKQTLLVENVTTLNRGIQFGYYVVHSSSKVYYFFFSGMETDRNVKVIGEDVAVL